MNDEVGCGRSTRWWSIGIWLVGILVCTAIFAVRNQWLKSPMIIEAVGSTGFISLSSASTPPGYIVGVFYRIMHNLSHPLVLIAYALVSGILCLVLRRKACGLRAYLPLLLVHLLFVCLYAVSLLTVIEVFRSTF